MNGYQKERAKTWLEGLSETHERIRESARERNAGAARDLLRGCQEGAISIGSRIEETEGEGFSTVAILEGYCEAVYRAYAALESAGGGEESACGKSEDAESACLEMDAAREAALRSLQRDVPERREILFLPYKASMWDSLESIWMAADADPSCEAVVLPIPYYDKNADGSLGEMHYDGGMFPEYVPVASYESYSIERRRPDVVYIHNPYDDLNRVTSVAPQYYSFELKKYVQKLVYVPYYSIAANMSEGKSLCKAYIYADYIVMQSKKHKDLFDNSLPKEKMLVLGSPKFDKIIRLCNNPPEPPVEWKYMLYREDGSRKKVYFYNTSLSGMLLDTRRFLLKMEYVFRAFQVRKECCLLWRPHPLMEATFESLRPDFMPFYKLLKDAFIEEGIGIFDETGDIEATIALCDAYIGDVGSSVVSLFGVAGKPIFLLNNNIHSLPEEDDWRGEMIRCFFIDGKDDWIVTQTNQLYYAPDHDYQYKFYCDLSDQVAGKSYSRAIEIKGKVYLCPLSAQEVIVVDDCRIQKRIPLARMIEQSEAFCGVEVVDEFLFLVPLFYPSIVRIDTKTDEVVYIEGYNEIFSQNVRGSRKIGGSCVFQQYLFLASPTEGRVISVDSITGEVETISIDEDGSGYMALRVVDDAIWCFPQDGMSVIRWKPETGEKKTFVLQVSGIQNEQFHQGDASNKRLFSSVAESKNKLVFAPACGNRFVCYNKETGLVKEWIPPFEMMEEEKNGYYSSWFRGIFLRRTDSLGEGTWRFFSGLDRRLYDVNLETNDYREISISFSREELEEHFIGFGSCFEGQPYACKEGALYSLEDFLDGKRLGRPFDREEQVKAYGEVAVNLDGSCGRKVHEAVMGSLD